MAQGDMAVPAGVRHLSQAHGTALGSLRLGLNTAVPEQLLWAETPLFCHLSDNSGPGMSPRAISSLGTAGADMDAAVISPEESPSRASLVTPGAVARDQGHSTGAKRPLCAPGEGTRHCHSKAQTKQGAAKPQPCPQGSPEVAVGYRSQPCAPS